MATNSEKRTQKLVAKLGAELRKMRDRHARKLEALNDRNAQEEEAFLSVLTEEMAELVREEETRQRAELASQTQLNVGDLGQSEEEPCPKDE